jgi:hypothetical protein
MCSFQVKRNRILSFRPNSRVMHPDGHQCLLLKLASVRMLFRVPEESNVSSASIRTTWQYRPDAIQCSTSKMISFVDTNMGRQLQPSGRQGNTVRTPVLIIEIACSRSATVRTLGQHRSDAALFRKEFQRFMESQLHSSPFGRPQLTSGRRLEITES